ncbi:MAG: excinuclease ABC subunit UvrC [Sphaerochaetaceae bacterium]|nr:excinuclease ABC subunit UvrC [Sphaerochaetaceae bacterium]
MEKEKENNNAYLQAKQLPENSGCYLMRDEKNTVIYVGKAKNLHKRVISYFLKDRDVKTKALVQKIKKIDHIITGNEYEALVLENNLIKKYNPHYNIMLKDGKSYPVIRITSEPFPKVFKTRRIIKDGSKYFGPFPDVRHLDQYLELIDRSFNFRKCGTPLKMRENPCLYYHLGRCSAPCCGKITQEDYNKNVQKVIKFLEGGEQKLIDTIRTEMLKASSLLNFELASKKRDVLKALESVALKQQVEGFNSESIDYCAIEMRVRICTVSIMQFRDGKLIGKALYRAETFGNETETLLNFLIQYYSDGQQLPKEIYVSHEIDFNLIKQYFETNLKHQIEVFIPQTGRHFRILKMARENAKRDVENRLKNKDNSSSLIVLKDILELESLPKLIEGFDIAQLGGKYTVASLISFYDGNPDPKNYRRFNIRSLDGRVDDYGAMKEAVHRRYSRVIKENLPIPDLILVDGGQGQVNVTRSELDELGLAQIPVVGLAKERETIVFDDDREDLNVGLSNEGLRVLIALRDECHRFATTANQAMRSKDASFKLLETIEGAGPKTSSRLMKEFVSLDALVDASLQELKTRGKVSDKLALRIKEKLSL